MNRYVKSMGAIAQNRPLGTCVARPHTGSFANKLPRVEAMKKDGSKAHERLHHFSRLRRIDVLGIGPFARLFARSLAERIVAFKA